QNFPVLTAVTKVAGGFQISGSLTASPNVTYRIEFFASNPDPLGQPAEGQTFLGAVNATTNASGTVSFSPTINVGLQPGQIVTATATNLTPDPMAQAGAVAVFNPSEFSPGLPVASPLFAAGTGAGFTPSAAVNVYDANGTVRFGLTPYSGFTGAVGVAV